MDGLRDFFPRFFFLKWAANLRLQFGAIGLPDCLKLVLFLGSDVGFTQAENALTRVDSP